MKTLDDTPMTIHTDLLTPLGAYLRLREGARASFLLESVERGRLGRYSFVGAGSRLVFLNEAEALAEPVVGYVGYDWAARLEPTVPLPADGPDVPGLALRRRGDARPLRPRHRAWRRCSSATPARWPRRSRARCRRSRRARARAGPLRRFPEQAVYEASVRRAQEHIRAGDAFQIVLSQRAERPTSASPLAVYRALRRVNPSPYLFLLELDGIALVGSSPETLVKCEGRRASLNPIAGTTTPGDGDAERLLASEKDRAEHVMLVDLGRNDLSRVCRPGSVRVERFMEAERFSHVTHLVSEVVGELQQASAPFDLLRATFPAGTVSGAPKVRAMQIISELEGHRRGPYAGAVGYALPDGTLDTCIAIRTVVLQDGVAYLQAGAGIVADSDPEAEHRRVPEQARRDRGGDRPGGAGAAR